ncbi:MAG: hypothetical protein WBW01_09775 [Terriglobales bacterium]
MRFYNLLLGRLPLVLWRLRHDLVLAVMSASASMTVISMQPRWLRGL